MCYGSRGHGVRLLQSSVDKGDGSMGQEESVYRAAASTTADR